MKLLLLCCSEEHGAADAIREAAGQRGILCDTADPSAVFPQPTKAQRLLSAVRRYGPTLREPGISLLADTNASARLRDSILRGGYDAVLCCDRVAAELMSAAKCGVPCYALLTDYADASLQNPQRMDGFFIPHEALKQMLVSQGVPPERIFPTGVPVAQHYEQRRSKDEARSALGILHDRQVYLIVAAGLRYDDISGLCDELCKDPSDAFVIYVLAERRSLIRAALERRYAGSEHVRVITRPRRAELYFQCADAAILSPNGFESTEAAVAGVPLVHLSSPRESGRQTARFFSQREMSLTCQSIADAVAKAKRLADQTAVAARMRQRQARDAYVGAADRILDRLCSGDVPALHTQHS